MQPSQTLDANAEVEALSALGVVSTDFMRSAFRSAPVGWRWRSSACPRKYPAL